MLLLLACPLHRPLLHLLLHHPLMHVLPQVCCQQQQKEQQQVRGCMMTAATPLPLMLPWRV